jgi:hypothetical protein
MLAGLKTQWSRCNEDLWPRGGIVGDFDAAQVERLLENLPLHLWPEKRRKRSYTNHVLARAELNSNYRPARKLWARCRNGRYLPNPAMLLRQAEGWRPLADALALDWIDRGSGTPRNPWARPKQIFAAVSQYADAAVPMAPGDGAQDLDPKGQPQAAVTP